MVDTPNVAIAAQLDMVSAEIRERKRDRERQREREREREREPGGGIVLQGLQAQNLFFSPEES